MKKAFGKAPLLELLEKIGDALDGSVTVYLIGGGAMAFRNQKDETKDLDLVFTSNRDCQRFSKVLPGLGFESKQVLEKAYEKMDATGGIWEGSGPRLDLFVKTVCKALSLSASMEARGTLLGTFGKLRVIMLSNEDIILLKAITERPDDSDDIARIVTSVGVDWEVILQECVSQSGERQWFGPVLDKLNELRDKHGISAPITREIEELDELSVIRDAYRRRLEKGLSKEKAIGELRKLGFTQKELKQAKLG